MKSELLKDLDEIGKQTFRTQLNEIIRTNKVPNEWNMGIILPLPKKEDVKESSNYRGITLVIVQVKVLARIMQGS